MIGSWRKRCAKRCGTRSATTSGWARTSCRIEAVSGILYAVAMRDRRGPTRCSFCGKTESQVRRIVAGPGVYICNECIHLCLEMLNEEPIGADTSKAEPPSALKAEIRHLHGLLRLESRLVKDLRTENERLKTKPKARARRRP